MTDDDRDVRERAAEGAGDALGDDRRDVRSEAEGGVAPEDDPEPAGDDTAASSAEPEAGRKKRKKEKKQGSFWKELPVLIGVALILALLIKTFLVQAFYIPSGSMEQTLQVGDRVLVNKVVYHTRDIERGDIVVFNGLDSWDDPSQQVTEPSNPVGRVLHAIGNAFGLVPGEKDYIKRVIGVAGDEVVCCDAQGRISVNGVALDEPYLYPGNEPSTREFSITVPEGRLWLMGDHRAISYDSRDHQGDPGGGTVPESRVAGRAFVVVWPVSRTSTLPIPETFEQRALQSAGAAMPAAPMALGFAGAVPIMWLYRRRRLRKGP